LLFWIKNKFIFKKLITNLFNKKKNEELAILVPIREEQIPR